MQIDQKMSGDVTVVHISGDITLNQGGEVLLKDKIQSLLQQGAKKIVLDLGGVAYVDSAGLGQLVPVHATKKLKDLLVVTKLVTVFDSYESEKEALASFN